MALISCDFYSEALEISAAMTVILPQQATSQVRTATNATSCQGAPVLYLLHGHHDDHTSWQRRTSLERYVAPLGLAVVMPAVHRSFYADEQHGHAYWTFLTEELPRLVSSFFRVSERREDTYVAGHSMGGYGAFKWALREPSRFVAAASMSGGLDISELARRPERQGQFQRIFGAGPGPSDDLFELLRSAHGEKLPALHVSCGTEDERIQSSRAFAEAAQKSGVDVTVDFPPGEHEWGFWDAEIQKVLRWLPGPGAETVERVTRIEPE